jgi:hypothetical protein
MIELLNNNLGVVIAFSLVAICGIYTFVLYFKAVILAFHRIRSKFKSLLFK